MRLGPEAEARRLLCVLLLRDGAMPAHSDRRCLLRLTSWKTRLAGRTSGDSPRINAMGLGHLEKTEAARKELAEKGLG
jgi:hypothetical protein